MIYPPYTYRVYPIPKLFPHQESEKLQKVASALNSWTAQFCMILGTNPRYNRIISSSLSLYSLYKDKSLQNRVYQIILLTLLAIDPTKALLLVTIHDLLLDLNSLSKGYD